MVTSPPDQPTDTYRSRLSIAVAAALPLAVVLPLLVGAVAHEPTALLAIFCWFDPILLIYNALLVGVAMSVPPLVVYAYVRTMRQEKLRRLRYDLGDEWPRHADAILERESRLGQFSSYLGGVLATTVLTGFGATILLLVKPLPLALIVAPPEGGLDACAGLDFGRGASFLLLGWFSQYLDDPARFYPTLMLALTAFQFGFLGAWIYFLSGLTRDYFACDLTPSSLIYASIRMATASLLALVVAFGLPLLPGLGLPDKPDDDAVALIRLMPIIAFFLGYFPSQALLVIERLVSRYLGTFISGRGQTSPATPLAVLAGVSYLHEVRLEREGIDNVANLAEADPLDLALRTGFRLPQLRRWVDEATLARHLGADYVPFLRATGIGSREDLLALVEAARQAGRDPVTLLVDCIEDAKLKAQLKPRLEVLCAVAATP